MKENNLSQLVGALGGWLQARPYGAEQDALDRAARIVLDMRLLGVDIDDVDAPELDALDPEDRDVVDQARVWAQARREEARRRRAADERAARQRRVAAREAGPNEAFAWPARPSAPAASVATPKPVDEPVRREVDVSPPTEPVDVHTSDEVAAVDAQEPVVPGEPIHSAEDRTAEHTAVLADPSQHEFFAEPEPGADAAMNTRRSRRLQPDAVFKVVLVIWAIAALGVLAVLLRIAFG